MAEFREVHPKKRPIDSVVRPPGSKSLTIRALACAALADGRSRLRSPLDSEDTLAARDAFRLLGVNVSENDEGWDVDGSNGMLVGPLDPIDAGASGLTARIVLGLAPLVSGALTVTGRDRLPGRPMDGILDVLAVQGVSVVSEGGYLPITLDARSAQVLGRLVVDASKSTQFVTAALLPAPVAEIPIVVVAEELSGSRGYLGLTVDVMRAFGADVEVSGNEFAVEAGGYRGVDYEVEPDASAAVYPMVAAAIAGGRVVVEGLGQKSHQPDYGIASILEKMGCRVERAVGSTTVIGPPVRLEPIDEDLSGSPDGALAVAVACLRASGSSRIRGLESLRYKESNRLSALATEINRTGGSAEIEGASLLIRPGNISHVQFETYSDHRMAMSLALLGLVSDGVSIGDPNVVAKTWPDFWKMLDQL